MAKELHPGNIVCRVSGGLISRTSTLIQVLYDYFKNEIKDIETPGQILLIFLQLVIFCVWSLHVCVMHSSLPICPHVPTDPTLKVACLALTESCAIFVIVPIVWKWLPVEMDGVPSVEHLYTKCCSKVGATCQLEVPLCEP